MKKRVTPSKRVFVSPSARQQRQSQAIWPNLSGVVREALRDLDAKSLPWPAKLRQAPRVETLRDDLCAAYLREATDPHLLRDHAIRTHDHALLVVRRGDLIIESAQCPFAVEQGDSAIVPAGWWRLTELPTPHSPICYWIIFFSPELIQAAFGDAELVQQMAVQTAPAYSGVYVQRSFLRHLNLRKLDSPVPNVLQTFRVLGALAGASFFMFLGRHYYGPRDDLQRLVRAALRSRCPVDQIGAGWPGGTRAFRRDLKAFHGVGVQAYATRTKEEVYKGL